MVILWCVAGIWCVNVSVHTCTSGVTESSVPSSDLTGKSAVDTLIRRLTWSSRLLSLYVFLSVKLWNN